ncbi:hypothetical protein AYO44_14910 [Planctomycetaceae bacterium SCGC AG-212-F19]|nr:hypothetical protein AYO44_14910 [Planctomycetaceae bacterium SCGC AG-212-F19]
MPLTAVGSLLDALRDCQLLRPAQFDELAREAPERFAEARTLAQHLLERGWVTPFQINQVLQERGADLLLGPYLLLERLGEGFGGTLFKARHQRMNRIVALRVVRPELLADPEAIRQFYAQVEVASKLDHDNLVHAYDAGPLGPTHFLATEYIAGTDLGRLVQQSGPLSVPHACSYVYQAALGLQHGFEHGLVHHGLKPSKVMVTQVPGSQSVGVVKVLELGLTRLLRIPSRSGATDSVQYQAPEQTADIHAADIRADIYSLGGIFIYLLTGQPPAAGTQLPATVPPAVAAIIRQMTAARPADRYPTPADVARALQEFVDIAAPSADVDLADSPSRMLGSTVNLLPRQPLPPPRMHMFEGLRWILLVGLGGALLVAGFFLCQMLLFPEAGARNQPPTVMEAPPGNWLDPANIAPEERTLAGPQPDLVAVLRGATSAVRAVRFHPRGMFVASGDDAGTIHLWDWNTGKKVSNWDAHGGKAVLSLAWSPDGLTLASGGKDKKIKLWDPNLRREKQWWPTQVDQVSYLAFTPDNQQLAGRFAGKEVKMVELVSGKDRHFLKNGTKTINALVISGDGKTMALGLHEKGLIFFELAGGKRTHSLENTHGGPLRALAFTSDSKWLATGGDDKTVKLWEMATAAPEERGALKGHTSPVVALAFAPDSQTLASAASDGHVILWRATDKVTAGEWHLPAAVHDLAISPDGRHLAAATGKGAVYVFRLPAAIAQEPR